MMNLIIIIAILITNIVALGLVYQILKKIPKRELLIFMSSIVAIIYIMVSIVYEISGIGIESNVHERAKNMIVYLFVPVNIILFIPYLAVQYRKVKEKKLKYLEFSNKIAIVIIIFIVLLVAEGFYFHNIQINIKEISEKQVETTNTVNENTVTTNTTIQNTITTNTVITNNVITNTVIENTISTNEIKTNTINEL